MKYSKTYYYASTIFVLLLITISSQTFGQTKWGNALNVDASVSVAGSTNDRLQPLWSYSNQWGVYTQYEQGEALAHIRARYSICESENVNISAGLGLIGKTEFDESKIHEAYLCGKFWMADFTIGMQAYSPVAKVDDLTAGNYLMSTNARPTPKIGVGIFDWWSLPYTKDWLQIKGGLYFGRLLNEDLENATKDVILHEKFVYGRLNGWYLKPYAGLIHSVMMGGVLSNGTKMPLDVWASFWAKGSDKFTGGLRGESTNAAGGHQGLWDAGVDFEFENFMGSVYCKRPFTDAQGKKYFDRRNKDFYLGANVTFKNFKYIKRASIEWMKTDFQSGNGNPDPVGYDKNGDLLLIYPGDLPEGEALKSWFDQHFEKSEIDDWIARTGREPYKDSKHAYDFFKYLWGHGYEYGGRANLISNGLYPQGWSAGGLSFSSAYFHSQKTVDIYGGDSPWQKLVAFPNTRINAITIAAEGDISQKLSYLLKFGVTKNHGSMIEKYLGGTNSWEIDENYFFKESKFEYYSMIKADYQLTDNLSFNTLLSADWGDLYSAVGLRFGIKYTISTNLR